MAAPHPKPYYTPEEYLAFERQSEIKHEYIDGYIYAMSGAKRAHNRISTNLTRLLDTQLLDRPCDVFGSDMRVKVSTRKYFYPDISVVCGPAHYEDIAVDTLVNPLVVVEILSPSTEGFDRGAKSEYYRQIPSLREYLLVAQDRMYVEHFLRHKGTWVLTETREPTDVVILPNIGCTLTLAEIYRRVDLPPAEPPDDSAEPTGDHS